MEIDLSSITLRPFKLIYVDDLMWAGDDQVTKFIGDDRFRADIGYAVAGKYWGQGIATRAVKIAVNEIFKDFPDVLRLQAYVYEKNKASQECYK
ncbi:hypothetical protein Patl1_23384 [Pistacia atlantica]|uniref:Uncharacterized protein n=1 Tax=Pistacia atlantica TaxID=434234 RepID=A0ACC1A1Q4_9ROSI|nr:hypothetical protein Patl1_23384 [Pistacia atlantica]